MKEIDTQVHVSASAAFPEGGSVALSVFFPDNIDNPEQISLLFCVHGGSYTRHYWNGHFPGLTDYSFAEHMTEAGFVVAAIDMLGMGESGRSSNPQYLNRAVIAKAASEVLDITIERLKDGTWAGARSVRSTGVGHSLGGMMVITQQAWHTSFDQLAVLGWSNKAPAVEAGVRDRLLEQSADGAYQALEIPMMRPFFYGDDVLEAVIIADEARAVDTPGLLTRDSFTEGLIAQAASQVRCPVFFGQATIDTSAEPHKEPAYFTGSNDITLAIFPSTAHCHNLASQRVALWDRIKGWVRSLPSQYNN